LTNNAVYCSTLYINKNHIEDYIKSRIDATYIKGIIDAAYINGIVNSNAPTKTWVNT
jgi:hypothetical protein